MDLRGTNEPLGGGNRMNITQEFYDSLASHYSKLFQDLDETIKEQAEMLDKLFSDNGYGKDAKVLDCACGIGTQTLGLAALGYNMSSSDISSKAMLEAKWESIRRNLTIRFAYTDFCKLADAFKDKFDIIIAIDNALPHMTSRESLRVAVESIVNQLGGGGMFVASIRDYDELLKTKPSYSPPYIHSTENGQRVSFQTWKWEGENYKFVQYIIEDEKTLEVKKFECEYRAVQR
ncbi:MAG: class I SAM-dependent methyltransferase, partial [Ruminococcaceae bacterium]|nr:class I SAM-dependent methyltransferase [Oscillospiraceae bacterium]